MRLTRPAIILFTLIVTAAPLYAVSEYSSLRNRISELAAQHAPQAWLMAAAFVCCGLAVVADGMRTLSLRQLPFITFGFCFALMGIFPIASGDLTLPVDQTANVLHVHLATVSGIALTAGLALTSWSTPVGARRFIDAGLAIFCIALPVAMLVWPSIQGLIQRTMYAIIFLWFWRYYPENTTVRT